MSAFARELRPSAGSMTCRGAESLVAFMRCVNVSLRSSLRIPPSFCVYGVRYVGILLCEHFSLFFPLSGANHKLFNLNPRSV